MSEIVNVHARSMRDLTTPTNMPAADDAFDQAKIPMGNMPVEYSDCEALTVGQLKETLNTAMVGELVENVEKLALETKNDLIYAVEGMTAEAALSASRAETSEAASLDNLNQVNAKAEEVNIAANLIITSNKGLGYYQTTTELQNAKPTQAQYLAEALDTRKIHLWTRTSAEGVTPVTGTWVVVGASIIDILKTYVNDNPNFAPKILGSANLNTITTQGFYIQMGSSSATPANNYPTQDAGFLRVDTAFGTGGVLSYGVQKFRPQSTARPGEYVRKWNFSSNQWGAWEFYDNTKNINATINTIRDQLLVNINQAKEYEVVEPKNGKNLIDTLKLRTGVYVSTNGGLNTEPNNKWAVTDFIPVTPGQTYTLSGIFGYCAYSFFANTTNTTSADSLKYERVTVLPHTFTAPAGANFIVVNVYSETGPGYSNIQLEKGALATEYVSGSDRRMIKRDYVKDIDAPKNYEAVIKGSAKNLFKSSEIMHGRYLNTSGVLMLVSTNDWGTSGFIPVTPGKSYTISGIFGYSGASFFSSEEAALNRSAPLLYQEPFTAAKTLVAPPNAQVLVINLYRNTAPNWSNVQVEEGTVQTEYASGDDFVGVRRDHIVPSIATSDLANTLDFASKVKFTFDRQVIVTASDSNSKYEHTMRIVDNENIERSMVSNFTQDKIDGAIVSTMNDDVAPPRLDDATVGANHGYSRSTIVAPNHGKTVADIGSLWTSASGAECILVDVVDVNTLYMTRTNTNTSLNTSQLTFTHSSGAQNTATINATSITSGQWYPSIKALKHRCFVDGNRVDLNKDLELFFNQDVVISETYEILSRASMVQQHVNNVGVRLTSYGNAQSVLSVTNNYRFDTDGGITIESEYLVLAPMTLRDIMMLQSILRVFPGGVSYYIPKVKPITIGETTYNFENPVNMVTSRPTADLTFTNAHKKENENLLDRVIQLSDNYGFALGFLPVLDAEYSKRGANTTEKQLYIPQHSLKVYPALVDNADTLVDVGVVFAGVGYRKYFKRIANSTAIYPVYSRHGDFLYMHWHNSGMKRVELPEKLMGRTFSVSEKSPTLQVISKVAGSTITVNNTAQHGYLVLKFD